MTSTQRLEVRLSDYHRRMLDEVATQRGLTASDAVRQLIEEEHESLSQQSRLAAVDGLAALDFDVPQDPEAVRRLILEMWDNDAQQAGA